MRQSVVLENMLAELLDFREYMSEEEAEATLRAVTSWGRYAEVFAYDDHAKRFSLENPH